VFLFLTGAEMQPERVRGTWPDARFVARGRLEPRPLTAVAAPAGPRYETWGIIIETPEAPASADARAVVTDDGRVFAVTIYPADDADPAAVLAAARYWELPPAYVRRLAIAANVQIEEYVY
jgi:hypothetical protein